MTISIDQFQYDTLSAAAWQARANSRLYGHTPVGCAVLADDSRVFTGCNIEHRLRSHDIHAEVNAISSSVSAGAKYVSTILIASTRDRLTPCGACLDWIFEMGGEDCLVFSERVPGRPEHRYIVRDLMPYYPF